MQKVIPSVKAIITENNKFLILKYIEKDLIIWDLPGGRINFAENPYNALTREVKEEINLEIKIIKPIGMWWFIYKFTGQQIICFTFLCTPKNNKVDLSKNPAKEKHIEYKWITKDKFINKKEYHADRESLIDLIKNLKL